MSFLHKQLHTIFVSVNYFFTLMAYNFRFFLKAAETLSKFGKITEANSITPATLTDLLLSLQQEIDENISYIYDEADNLYVNSRQGCSLQTHLNYIYDHLYIFDSVIESIKQAGLLPEQVTIFVSLTQGIYNETNKDIHWYAANGKIVLHQWKANSTTNVSASYIAAPRLYKEHILHIQAMEGYKLISVTISYSGQYKGDSLIAGIELDDTSANVVNDELAIARTWGVVNDGSHTLSTRSFDGVSNIYLQNVATTVVQLRITSIYVTYKNIV